VIVFDFYSTLASYALGMFMCLKMPTAVSAAVSWHWVLDVRMQCPLQRLDKWWGKHALGLGIFLLVLCIIYPLVIAIVLVRKALDNTLDPKRSATSTPRDHEHDGGLWGSIASSLSFRFADYNVDYEEWAEPSTDDNSERRGVVRAIQEAWQCIKQWFSDFWSSKRHPVGDSLAQLRRLLVLTWDSILDLQRLVLALLGLSVMLHELHQILLVALALGIYLMLMLAVRPWRSEAIFRLQVLAASVLVLSCCGIMACNVSGDGHYSDDDTQRYTNAVGWAVIVINLVYMFIGFGTLFVCVCRKFARWWGRHNGQQRWCLAVLVESAGQRVRSFIGVSQYGPQREVRGPHRV
jgi:hypothetical protein